MHAEQAYKKLIKYDFQSVLDLGSGFGYAAKRFREIGKDVATLSYIPPADYVGDYLSFIELPKFDCIWCSHVLEHQLNVNLFLKKCFNDLKDDGILAITVPPKKDSIVGGHITIWNAGLLLYNLVLAGFDCSQASVLSEGYNISVIVRKKPSVLEGLIMDYGDIEKISKYFPFDAKNGFDGNIQELNW